MDFSPGSRVKTIWEGRGRMWALIHSACPTKGFAFTSAAGLHFRKAGVVFAVSKMEKLAIEGKGHLKRQYSFVCVCVCDMVARAHTSLIPALGNQRQADLCTFRPP